MAIKTDVVRNILKNIISTTPEEASVVFTYIMYIDVHVAFGMCAKCIKMEGFLVGLVYEVV